MQMVTHMLYFQLCELCATFQQHVVNICDCIECTKAQ